jgi:hypothetical protein
MKGGERFAAVGRSNREGKTQDYCARRSSHSSGKVPLTIFERVSAPTTGRETKMIEWGGKQIHFDTDLRAIGAFEELLGRLEGTTFLPLIPSAQMQLLVEDMETCHLTIEQLLDGVPHEGAKALEARWLKVQDDIAETAVHVATEGALAAAERGLQAQETVPAIDLLQRSVGSLQRRVDRLNKLNQRQQDLVSDAAMDLLPENLVAMTQAVAKLLRRPNPNVQKNVFDAVDNNHFRLGRMIFQRLNV